MSFRPGMAKGPNLAAAAGSVTPTTFLGRYARTLILPRDFAPGIHTQYVQHISPPTYPGTKLSYLACEQRLNAPEGADFSELRVVVKPPDYYAGLSPLKIRHWTFFPSVTRTVFGITPTPEELEVTAYCWWVPAGWDFQNYTGVAATPSVASHAHATSSSGRSSSRRAASGSSR